MTRSRLSLGLLLLFTLVCLGACGSGETVDTTGDVSDETTEATGLDTSSDTGPDSDLPDSLELSEEDGGTSLAIQQGGTIVLTLEANPSTGYSWEMNDEDPEASLLLQMGEPVFNSDDPEAAGAGGTMTYTFTAADVGQMTVSMIYLGPAVEEAPTKTFEFDLTVK